MKTVFICEWFELEDSVSRSLFFGSDLGMEGLHLDCIEEETGVSALGGGAFLGHSSAPKETSIALKGCAFLCARPQRSQGQKLWSHRMGPEKWNADSISGAHFRPVRTLLTQPHVGVKTNTLQSMLLSGKINFIPERSI